jgi:hypothetical protein
MPPFESRTDYLAFEYATKRDRRHVFSDRTRSFLDAVVATSSARKWVMHEGTILYRAQLGHDEEKVSEDEDEYAPCAFGRDRMRPLPHSACEGRVNPKGIPCLYLADNPTTAMAEVRPWVQSYISLSQFRISKNVQLVDCSLDSDVGVSDVLFQDSASGDFEKLAWTQISHAFSEPVSTNDRTADYAPTQVLAEVFKSCGFDGIAYNSRLSIGKNVALFDLESAEPISYTLHQTTGVEFQFRQVGSTSYVLSYFPEIKKQMFPEADDPGDRQQL